MTLEVVLWPLHVCGYTYNCMPTSMHTHEQIEVNQSDINILYNKHTDSCSAHHLCGGNKSYLCTWRGTYWPPVSGVCDVGINMFHRSYGRLISGVESFPAHKQVICVTCRVDFNKSTHIQDKFQRDLCELTLLCLNTKIKLSIKSANQV